MFLFYYCTHRTYIQLYTVSVSSYSHPCTYYRTVRSSTVIIPNVLHGVLVVIVVVDFLELLDLLLVVKLKTPQVP